MMLTSGSVHLRELFHSEGPEIDKPLIQADECAK